MVLEALSLKSIARSASILTTVINEEVAKTKTRFLTFEPKLLGGVIIFLVTVAANHLAWVLLGSIFVIVTTTTIKSINNVDPKG